MIKVDLICKALPRLPVLDSPQNSQSDGSTLSLRHWLTSSTDKPSVDMYIYMYMYIHMCGRKWVADVQRG